MSIRVADKILIDKPNAKIVVLAPTLALLDQLATEWARHRPFNNDYALLPVASAGASLGKSKKSGLPTILDNTTTGKEIAEVLQRPGRVVVFCTYQSAGSLRNAAEIMGDFSFDMAIMDEAHRTAGNGKTPESSFVLCLDDRIPADRRLFLTATPRVRGTLSTAKASGPTMSLRAQYIAEGNSMRDTKVYGDVVYKYSVSEAISDKMLADYRIWVIMISDADLRKAVMMDSNIDLTGVDFKNPAKKDIKKVASAKNLAIIAALARMHEQGTVTGALTFHHERDGSMLYSENASRFLKDSEDQNISEAFTAHVDGFTAQRERQRIMSEFRKAHNDGRFAMISNCQVFTEGVDVPELDTVVFVDNKTSETSIVQAVGRALRLNKNNPNKVANVVIPIFIGDEEPEAEINDSEYAPLYGIISALRDSDNMETYYSKAIMRQTLKEAGVSDEDEDEDEDSFIGVSDVDGNVISGSEDSAIMFVAPDSEGASAMMSGIIAASYREFAESCEAKLVGSFYSQFERNLGKLAAYKELAANRRTIGKDQPYTTFTIPNDHTVGNFAIGREMGKVRAAFDAGTLPENERAAYAELGFDLTTMDDLADEFRALAAVLGK